MKTVCWLDETGLISEKLAPGKIYLVNFNTLVEFRLFNSFALNSSCELIVKSSENLRISFEKSEKEYFKCQNLMNSPGPFVFCLKHIDPLSKSIKTSADSVIQVAPELRVNKKIIPHSLISLQTNLSRSLGPFSNWVSQLSSQVALGYNLFHITAVQKLGKYNSLYSIGDYLEFNSDFFLDPDLSNNDQRNLFENTIKSIELSGAGVIIDLVLSHCSSLNPLLLTSPNSYYSVKNHPHLNSAYLLDNSLFGLSCKIAEKSLEIYTKGNKIENEEDLQAIMNFVKEIVKDLKLFEFFQMDTEAVMKSFINSEENFEEGNENLKENCEYLRNKGIKAFIKKFCLLNQGEQRNGIKLNEPKIWRTCRSIGMPSAAIIREVVKEISSLNTLLNARSNRFVQQILKNIESEIRYRFIETREFEVTYEHPLVKPYFCKLPNEEIALLNGFIINNKDVTRDIASKWEYLKRNVTCWRDCVKLNYGSSFESCPELWETIEKYVVHMSSVCKGVRIDNCHGIPLHVTKYLIDKARKVNPHLLVIAEFFSSSSELDSKYVSEIGISFLIRELLPHTSIENLDSYFFSSSYPNFSKIPHIIQDIPIILFDFTHDNPTILQSKCLEDAITNMLISSFSQSAVGSTRGYDEMIPNQLSVIEEKRHYFKPELPYFCKEVYVMGFTENCIKVIVEFAGKASQVEIRGDWDGWKRPVLLEPINNRFKVCLVFPESQRGMNYGFKFILNGNDWVCDETQRLYRTWDGFFNNLLRVEENLESLKEKSQSLTQIRARANYLRTVFMSGEYFELEIKHCTHLITMKRENSQNFHGYVLILKRFSSACDQIFEEIEIFGEIEKVEFVALLTRDGNYVENKSLINGVPIKVESKYLQEFGTIRKEGENDIITFTSFPKGLGILVKTKPREELPIIEVNKHLNLLKNYSSARMKIGGINLKDLNLILWKTPYQEKNEFNRNIYVFPESENLRFAGMYGIVDMVNHIGKMNAIFRNLSQGNWYLDYQINRILKVSSQVFYFFIHDTGIHLKQIPSKIKPIFVIRFFEHVFKALKKFCVTELFKNKVFPNKIMFMASQIITGEPSENFIVNKIHSSQEILDFEYFITLQTLIFTENFAEISQILGKIACRFRKGAFINDKNSEEPCASLYFLFTLQKFIEKSPENNSIMSLNIDEKQMHEIITEIFEYLSQKYLDQESGLLILPPNQTWMKTASREGSPIEITSLLYSCLMFFSQIPSLVPNLFLKKWAENVKESFESLYWVPSNQLSIYVNYKLCTSRGIYKDTVGSSIENEEYLLRPNVFIALAIAPNLFSYDFTLKFLANSTSCLVSEENFSIKSLSTNEKLFNKSSEYFGKEWFWIYCWYLIGSLNFGYVTKEKVWKFIECVMKNFQKFMEQDDNFGINYTSFLMVLEKVKNN